MPEQDLIIEVRASNRLSRKDLGEIVSLCSRAYDEPYQPYLQTFSEPVHIMARIAGVLVSHALWITRWMQVEGGQLLKTAYVEAVATEEDQRGKGYASAVMTCLAEQIQGYDIGGLSPAETSLYSRLGWEYWQGPLYARKEGQWLLVTEESAMILRTAITPPFDIHAPLSIEWREGEIW